MGIWGTAISSNDTYADIYSEFKELYNDGMDIIEITAKLINENWEITNNPDDANNFWFAVAKSQWEYKQLQPLILSRVTEIIESGADIEFWRELGASNKDIKKRKEILDKFLLTLQSERPKAKSRKKIKITIPQFKKGECITFQLENGNYGGAVILEALNVHHIGYNLIATTRINQAEKPVLKNFETSEVLILNHSNWKDKACIKWVPTIEKYTKQTESAIEKIGIIKVDKLFLEELDNYLTGPLDIAQQSNMQFESEKTKQVSKIKISIKSLVRNKSWKFWQ